MDGLGIDHRLHHHHHQYHHAPFATTQQPTKTSRKRKPEAPPENNERLSKRMSLLNLEHSGQKLYVPVENTNWQSTAILPSSTTAQTSFTTTHKKKSSPVDDDSQMRLDDTKYKVYIYNLDDELSSDSESESGKLVFLPDIEKHLRTSRIPIPPFIRDPPDPASPAGRELVLYGVPSSISVPEERDSVRKAIIEARARARERQLAGLSPRKEVEEQARVVGEGDVPMDAEPNGFAVVAPVDVNVPAEEEDPDAMDLD